MKKIIFIMLLLTTHLVFGEEKTMSLTCNGKETSINKLLFWKTKDNKTISLVFKDGELIDQNNESWNNEKQVVKCKWDSQEVVCKGIGFFFIKKNENKPENERNYLIKINRVTGSILMNWNNHFEGVCNLRQSF
jgi:hypothetical protein